MLTSHYMADVEALCRRVIVIHQGRLLYDGDLTGLVQRFAAHKTITVELEEGAQVAGSLAAGLVNGAGTRSALSATSTPQCGRDSQPGSRSMFPESAQNSCIASTPTMWPKPSKPQSSTATPPPVRTSISSRPPP
jgi:ABC-type multidrug transport system ATPase subunit